MAEANVVRSDFYVYVLFRPDTGHPFYVGKGTGRRIETTMYDTSNPHKANIAAKFKNAGISVPAVKIAQGLREDDALQLEIAFTRAIGRGLDGPLVNMTDGGGGMSGHKPSSSANEKRSKSLRGRVFPHQIGNQFAKGNSHKLSMETRLKQSAALKGKPSKCLGQKRSAEFCLRMKALHQDKIWMTDGVTSKKVTRGAELPLGWRLGHCLRQKRDAKP